MLPLCFVIEPVVVSTLVCLWWWCNGAVRPTVNLEPRLESWMTNMHARSNELHWPALLKRAIIHADMYHQSCILDDIKPAHVQSSHRSSSEIWRGATGPHVEYFVPQNYLLWVCDGCGPAAPELVVSTCTIHRAPVHYTAADYGVSHTENFTNERIVKVLRATVSVGYDWMHAHTSVRI